MVPQIDVNRGDRQVSGNDRSLSTGDSGLERCVHPNGHEPEEVVSTWVSTSIVGRNPCISIERQRWAQSVNVFYRSCLPTDLDIVSLRHFVTFAVSTGLAGGGVDLFVILATIQEDDNTRLNPNNAQPDGRKG